MLSELDFFSKWYKRKLKRILKMTMTLSKKPVNLIVIEIIPVTTLMCRKSLA